MKQLILTEFYKMRKNRSLLFLLGIALFLSLFNVVLSVIDGTFATTSCADYVGQSFSDGRMLLFLLSGCFSGLFFGTDFSVRYYQSAISCGQKRSSIFLSKILFFSLGTLLISFFYSVPGPLLFVSLTNAPSPAFVGSLFQSTFLFSLLLICLNLVCAVSAMMIKKKTTTLAINMFLLVLIDAFFQLGASFNELIRKIYMESPFAKMLLLIVEPSSSTDIILSLSIALCIGGLLFGIGLFLFKKMELK